MPLCCTENMGIRNFNQINESKALTLENMGDTTDDQTKQFTAEYDLLKANFSNLETVTEYLRNKTALHEIAISDLENNTNLLFASTGNLKKQAMQQKNFTSSFQKTTHRFKRSTEILSSNLEKTSRIFHNATTNLQNSIFFLTSGEIFDCLKDFEKRIRVLHKKTDK